MVHKSRTRRRLQKRASDASAPGPRPSAAAPPSAAGLAAADVNVRKTEARPPAAHGDRRGEPEVVYIGGAQVRARYGGVSDMWIWRKLNDPASNFPPPYHFGGSPIRMWRLSELEAWERMNASRTAAQRPRSTGDSVPAA